MKKLIFLLLLIVIVSGCAQRTTGNIADGDRVELIGKVSNTPWQHLIKKPEGYIFIDYMDFEDDQLVVYSKEFIECEGEVKIKGTVFQLEGTSKRPGSEEPYNELQIAVDEFECVD